VKLLLDEDVPVQMHEPLRRLLPGHTVDHVQLIGWKGKKDKFLLPDAAARGYDALITNDSGQLDNPDECRAIRDSGMHHVRYPIRDGLDRLALAIAAVMAAIRPVVAELSSAGGQRLVLVQSIQAGRRHTTTDPADSPPPYWPGSGNRRLDQLACPGSKHFAELELTVSKDRQKLAADNDGMHQPAH